jgi:hypothetical protein
MQALKEASAAGVGPFEVRVLVGQDQPNNSRAKTLG